jgi:hypothetical protein
MTEPAPSPYLPGTKIQVAWDSTSLGYLKTCPRLYQYSMLEGWSSREESVHLRFGIEYHHALQDYDLSRAADINHDDAVFDVVKELLIRTADFDPDHKTKTREGLVRTVIWYLDKFRDDPASTFILSDGKPAVEQSFRFELDWGPQSALNITATEIEKRRQGKGEMIIGQPYILCGHLDKIVTYNDELFAKDYKTVWSFWGKRWEPDNQMTLYSLASKVILNAPVKGVIIDMAQIKEDTTEFKREFTFRTPDQLEEWLRDLRYWLTLAEQYAIADYWPQNDTACDKFGGCRFRDICSKSPSVRERFLEGNFIKLPEDQKWNPLRAR